MIELIPFTEPQKWQSILAKYDQADTYYQCNYVASLQMQEQGTAYLLSYSSENYALCYPIIEKDIAASGLFEDKLPSEQYFDWNTPYGYAGPLVNKAFFPEEEQIKFKQELYKLAEKRNVVSQFVRFHPLLQNHSICDRVIEKKYLKETIFIDLATSDDLMKQMDSKNRNLIRKAQKSEIQITYDHGEHLEEFMTIYQATMDRDNADTFYYFPKTYYEFLKTHMPQQTIYFYAYKENKMVAAALFFYDQHAMHYHLSGCLNEGKAFAPTQLILYEAANWARAKNIPKLHLGGGIEAEDSLFHFKKQFNKQGRLGFWIGKNVFLPKVYERLLQYRQELNEDFPKIPSFMIGYRQPNKEKILAIIPARSGSKGLKDKNIRPLNGKPLMAYTIEAALQSKLFETVHVSTDSAEYAEIAKKYGADVPFLRDAITSGDTASTDEAVKEVLNKYAKQGKKFDYLFLLQPTSPLRTAEHIQKAYALYKTKKAPTLTSVCEVDHPLEWCFKVDDTLTIGEFANSPYKLTRRQELPQYYRENGAIYISRVKDFQTDAFDFYTSDCAVFKMSRQESIDIDGWEDFILAEVLLNLQHTTSDETKKIQTTKIEKF
jgi:CMP-N-acetylneuraminic acid synthetase